jgi:DNA-binding cell septation regulator SpoVG
MFEVPKKDEQETKKMRELIGAATLAIILVVVVFYFTSQRGAVGPVASATPAAPCAADPVNDLTVVDAKMDKDRTGTTAVWIVRLRNKSRGCAYASVAFETTYIRADDSVVAVNKGTLPGTIAPGEEKGYPEFRDILFPTGTAWFRFKVTGAKVATP